MLNRSNTATVARVPCRAAAWEQVAMTLRVDAPAYSPDSPMPFESTQFAEPSCRLDAARARTGYRWGDKTMKRSQTRSILIGLTVLALAPVSSPACSPRACPPRLRSQPNPSRLHPRPCRRSSRRSLHLRHNNRNPCVASGKAFAAKSLTVIRTPSRSRSSTPGHRRYPQRRTESEIRTSLQRLRGGA